MSPSRWRSFATLSPCENLTTILYLCHGWTISLSTVIWRYTNLFGRMEDDPKQPYQLIWRRGKLRWMEKVRSLLVDDRLVCPERRSYKRCLRCANHHPLLQRLYLHIVIFLMWQGRGGKSTVEERVAFDEEGMSVRSGSPQPSGLPSPEAMDIDPPVPSDQLGPM